jgi:hypothetical protein
MDLALIAALLVAPQRNRAFGLRPMNNTQMNFLKKYAYVLGVTLSALVCLLSSTTTYGQEDSVKTLIKKFDNYYNNTLQEKLFLHTDRSIYLTGETVWLKIYNVDASLNKIIHVSKVAYVDIIDASKNAIVQKKITINGTGSGAVFLSASISSGNYQIRAYTSWMKNFSPDLFFEQTITIINPFIKLGLKAQENNKPKYDVQFFPEGGNLVYGLQSKSAFRAVDQKGHGVNFTGAIINEANDTVVTFKPHKFGIGNFVLSPQPGHQYRAVITDKENKKVLYDLPTIQDTGYALQVNDTSANWIVITATSNRPAELNLVPVYLFIHAKQNVIACEMHLLQSGSTSFILDKKKIKEGISHLTIFNNKLLPVCERLYFKQPEQKIVLEAKSDLNQYTLRKKVKIEISASSTNGQPMIMNLSAAVFKKDGLQNDDNINIEKYLLLTSELKGNVESPEYYISSEKSTEKSQAVDNLMLTHGWSRFKWENVLQGNSNFQYLPEIRSNVITGYVTNTTTEAPAPSIVTYLASPDKNIRLYLSRSDSAGRVEFETVNFYDTKDITVRTNTRQDSIYAVKLSNPFSDNYSSVKTPPFDLLEDTKIALEQKAVHMQVQNVFYEKRINQNKKDLSDSSTFYGKPDKRYFLDDYTRFPTMEEVMREYIAEVNVRKRGGKFHFYNVDIPNNTIFLDEPLVLIDGVPIFDTDKIIAFDPRRIKRLDVISRTYYLGALSFPGIVSYNTYKSDMGGFELDSKILAQTYEGVQSNREFFSPIYETQQARASTLPDTRNLLHWSPTITTNADGKAHFEFYTSDVTGKFNVVIQGLSKEGKPGYSLTTFEVKDKLNY